MTVPVLEARGVSFGFAGGALVIEDADLTIERGERVGLVGPSGCGKSTLLYLLAGILVPTTGEVRLDGELLSDLDQDARARLRLEHFGFVFQFGELLPELTLFENASLPGRIQRAHDTSTAAVDAVFARLGISQVRDRIPSRVSGGQRQRAALARAVAHRPSVVFADEPTGALDSAAGAAALAELSGLSSEYGASLLVVTHDREVARSMDRVVEMADGRLTR